MKLFTTYAGLSLLGPDHVWRNRVYTDGPVRDGVLQGNLVVRGSGDPKLVVERLQELLVQVRAAGVREVRGDIVLDRSVFDLRERSEPFDDEPLRPYNVGPDGLLLNFKAVVYKFTPDAAASALCGPLPGQLRRARMARRLPRARSLCAPRHAGNVARCGRTTHGAGALRHSPGIGTAAAGGTLLAFVRDHPRHQQILEQRDGAAAVPDAVKRAGRARAL
jgi:hypothetical protein